MQDREMNPFSVIGKPLSLVRKTLGVVSVEPVYDSLEEGEQQEYSVVSQAGKWEASLDQNNIIKTIFLYLNKGCDGVLGLDYSMIKSNVLELLGEPVSTGEPRVDSILGEYGAWEKYVHDNVFVHVEHESKENNIKQITIMVEKVA
ncbi:hypothetical protein ACJJI3_03595 [Microbulbifer sp. ZKSA004]|uniref:hypothetical protein n=1 Tax=Microbulbifer sp. ZKSA004 TaxID=3243389 RepID=UPI00403A43B6